MSAVTALWRYDFSGLWASAPGTILRDLTPAWSVAMAPGPTRGTSPGTEFSRCIPDRAARREIVGFPSSKKAKDVVNYNRSQGRCLFFSSFGEGRGADGGRAAVSPALNKSCLGKWLKHVSIHKSTARTYRKARKRRDFHQCSAYSVVSAIKNPFCSEVIHTQLQT